MFNRGLPNNYGIRECALLDNPKCGVYGLPQREYVINPHRLRTHTHEKNSLEKSKITNKQKIAITKTK